MSGTAHAPEDPRLEGLRPADQTAALVPYLRSVWERRFYIWHVARGELRGKQMDTVLGSLWHLLNPALQIGVYFIIFDLVLGVNRGVDNFVAFIAVGTLVFQFSQRSVIAGSKAIFANKNILKSIWFPRAILPATSTLKELLAFVPGAVVMIAVCLVTGEHPHILWLFVPVLLVAQTLLNTGLALAAARWGDAFPDVQQMLPFVFRLLLYASGVLFLVDAYVEHSKWRLLFELNPFYGYVSMYRWAILDYPVAGHVVVVTLVSSVLCLIAGFWWFRRAERTYGLD